MGLGLQKDRSLILLCLMAGLDIKQLSTSASSQSQWLTGLSHMLRRVAHERYFYTDMSRVKSLMKDIFIRI
jgi:hypothetical protein